RAVQLQRPHGPAPRAVHGRGAAPCPRDAGVDAAGDPTAPVARLPSGALLRAVPARADRLQPRPRVHALARARGLQSPQSARGRPRPRCDLFERPRGVDAGAEPAARDPAAVAAAADALLVLSVDRADDPGLVPHVRELTALSLLRARPAPVGSDDRR